MSEDIPFFSKLNMTIIGLGLMGGSLALAMKGYCKKLSVVDKDVDTLRKANEMGIADLVTDNPKIALADANIVILATPVNVIIKYLEELPDMISHETVVMDIGSTKSQIVDAMQLLPGRFDPIGGHPMCGKEKLSLNNAHPGLFNQAPFAFVKLKRTSDAAVNIAEGMCSILGAHPVWIDAETHDRWTAATSHLPFLVANALVEVLPDKATALIGPGFISTTRLAATPGSMMMDILKTNREDVIAAIDQLQVRLTEYRELLQQKDDAELALILAEVEKKQSAMVNKTWERKPQ